MGKVNAKAIREEARKEFARKHGIEIERFRERNADLSSRLNKAETEAWKAKQENEKLKEQLATQKEWIERLMDFVNMPDDERHDAIQKYITNRKMTEDFQALFAPYFKVLNRMNILF